MSAAARVLAAARGAGEASDLLYLYCVVEAGTPAERMLAECSLPGMAPKQPLFPIEVGGLVAAVSGVPVASFGEAPLNALLADLPRLAPLVVRHEETVRALLPEAPALIPLTFGAVYRGPERVRALLHERGGEFRRLLDRLRDRQEWGLKAFADPARLLAAAQETSADLRQIDAERAGSGPGRAYLLGKRRERLLAAEADRLLRGLLQEMLARLGGLSAGLRRDDPASGQTDATPLVLKAAFLVDEAQVERFRVAATGLVDEYGRLGLRLEVSGPWAPYSFVADERDAV